MFSPTANLGAKLALAGVLMTVVLGTLALSVWREHAYQALGSPLAQPIPFSHKHHVGDDGIDCRYCHTTVETGRHAGLPSTQICLSCHSQLYTDAAVLQPLRESARTGAPIVWQRVHALPDFVYFNHSVHVAKGVACVECHGRVDQMPLTWRDKPLQMQWCVSCHRDPTPHLRPLSEVFAMGERKLTARQAEDLARLMRLEQRGRLTDCSTCHR